MSLAIEVKVPDIGDFKDVPIIEVLVKPGDSVEKETPLIALESDKATMEVPSPAAGTVQDIKVKVGDKVSEGSLILLLNGFGQTAAPRPAQSTPAAPAPSKQSAPAAAPPQPAPGQSAGGVTEVKVPDIGDFKDIPVIEIQVKPGDRVEKEAPLITLESDKATME